jgi:hypothetical protein
MSAAHRLPDHVPAPMIAQRGGPATCPKMSFYDLQNRFWQLHAEASFSVGATHLYFYLLHQFNVARWPEKLYRKRNQLAAELSIDVKSLDTARERLVARGLLTYEPGDKVKSAIWSLGDCSQMEGKISPSSENSPQMEGKFSLAKRDNTPDSPQMEGKISPLYKEEEKTIEQEEEKTTSPAADAAAARSEKKIGATTSDLPADDSVSAPRVAPPPRAKRKRPRCRC